MMMLRTFVICGLFLGCGGTETSKSRETTTIHAQALGDEPKASEVDSSAVIAKFGDQNITLGQLDAHAKNQLDSVRRKYEMNVYETRQGALTELLQLRMMEKERALNKYADQDELFKKEVLEKVARPTEAETKTFFDENSKVIGDKPFASIKDEIGQHLFRQRLEEATQTYLEGLEAKYQVVTLLEPFREAVGTEGASKGPDDAPITIVEYADFQCPYCVMTAEAIDQVFAEYPGKVRILFRHFPLSFHEFAMQAAIASRCADKQGKFWAMHDKMYALSDELDAEKIRASAAEVGLELKTFETCIADPAEKSAVDAEMKRGSEFGVEGTPAVFLNGIPLQGAQSLESLKAVIDRELKSR